MNEELPTFPKYIKFTTRLYVKQLDTLRAIALASGVPWTTVLRQFIEEGIVKYNAQVQPGITEDLTIDVIQQYPVHQLHGIAESDYKIFLREVLDKSLDAYRTYSQKVERKNGQFQGFVRDLLDVATEFYPSIKIIAEQEKTDFKTIFREMLSVSINNYLHKKGTFICQKCGTPQPNKRKHEVPVDQETIVFGDCCYFNDSYKELVKQLL
jgi:hypothetical protein